MMSVKIQGRQSFETGEYSSVILFIKPSGAERGMISGKDFMDIYGCIILLRKDVPLMRSSKDV